MATIIITMNMRFALKIISGFGTTFHVFFFLIPLQNLDKTRLFYIQSDHDREVQRFPIEKIRNLIQDRGSMKTSRRRGQFANF